MTPATIVNALAVVLALSACGPAYRTVYDYSPPHQQGASACIGMCESTRDDCERATALETENCELRATAAYDACERDANATYNQCLARQRPVPTTVCMLGVCFRPSCSAQSTRCTDDYNRCYQNCGGEVTSRQECVDRCDGE